MDSVADLINKLGDKSRRVRQKAERELVGIGRPAVEPLIRALKNDRFAVRCRAANALGKIKDIRAIEPLIRRFTDDQQVQIKATIALGKIGKPAVMPLLRVLEDDNWEIREGAVMALGEARDLGAVEPLLNFLKDDCSTVRWRAANALGRIADERAIQPLISAFKDRDLLVRWSASSALGKTGKAAVEPLLQALQDADWETRYGATRALDGIVGIKTIELLVQVLEDERSEVRCRAASILGDSGDARAVQPLNRALKDSNLVVRLHAAEALGKLGDSSAIEPLLNTFREDEYAVREAVAISLTKLRDPILGPILRRMKLRSGIIHNGIIRTRERKRFSVFIEPLTQALLDGNCATKVSAALALSVIGGPRPIEYLAQTIKTDKDEDVRVAAVISLGIIGRARAKEILKQTLNDRSFRIRSKAVNALAFLRDISAIEPLLKDMKEEDKEVRRNTAEDLGYLGGWNKEAYAIIRAALENVEDDIQKEATYALEIMEEEKEHEALYAEMWEA